MPGSLDGLGPVGIGAFQVARVGVSTAALRVTGQWGEPARRPAALRTIERAVELGAQLIEVPGPFGPWADLVREAEVEPDEVVVALRLTGRDPARDLEAAAGRLGRRLAGRIGLVIADRVLLDRARAAAGAGVAVGAVVTGGASPSALGPVAAVRGAFPPDRRVLEWCEEREVPYLASDPRILTAGDHTLALLEPAGRADIERLWAGLGAVIPPAAGPG